MSTPQNNIFHRIRQNQVQNIAAATSELITVQQSFHDQSHKMKEVDTGVMSHLTGPTKVTEKPQSMSTNTRPPTYLYQSKDKRTQFSSSFVKKFGQEEEIERIREGL